MTKYVSLPRVMDLRRDNLLLIMLEELHLHNSLAILIGCKSFGREMMWEHSIDLVYTFTPLSRRWRHVSQWKNSSNSWTERLLLRFYLPRSSIEQKNITSNTLQKEVDLVLNNLLRKGAMIQSDATAKLLLFNMQFWAYDCL